MSQEDDEDMQAQIEEALRRSRVPDDDVDMQAQIEEALRRSRVETTIDESNLADALANSLTTRDEELALAMQREQLRLLEADLHKNLSEDQPPNHATEWQQQRSHTRKPTQSGKHSRPSSTLQYSSAAHPNGRAAAYTGSQQPRPTHPYPLPIPYSNHTNSAQLRPQTLSTARTRGSAPSDDRGSPRRNPAISGTRQHLPQHRELSSPSRPNNNFTRSSYPASKSPQSPSYQQQQPARTTAATSSSPPTYAAAAATGTRASPARQYTSAPPAPQYTGASSVPQYSAAPPAPQYSAAPPAPQYSAAPLAPQYSAAPPAPQHTGASPVPQYKPPSLRGNTSQASPSNASPSSDTPRVVIPEGQPAVVVDGQNVGCEYSGTNKFRSRGVEVALDYYATNGIPAVAVLPRNKVDTRPYLGKGVPNTLVADDPALLLKLSEQGRVFFTPAGAHDDYFVLTYAMRKDADIISNDRFVKELELQDTAQDVRTLKSFLDRHLIPYTFIAEDFVPNPNPSQLGRTIHQSRGTRR